MIQEYARLGRPYFVLLAIVTVGRWLMGTAFAVPYEKGTNILSIVTLTLFASIFSAAFTRRWLDWRLRFVKQMRRRLCEFGPIGPLWIQR